MSPLISEVTPRRTALHDEVSPVITGAFVPQYAPELPTASSVNPDAAILDDTELMAIVRARNPIGLELLFDRYFRVVLDIAHRVLGDWYEAEDVVQEVFFYVYEKSQLFDPAKGSAKAWIIQIAVSRSLDRKLCSNRRRFYAITDTATEELRGQTDLDQEIEAKLIRKHLEKAFSELTEMQRRTIQFFYFEGLDLREISEQLSEPLGNVRHHLYRGLERLRKSSLLHKLRCK